MIQVERHDRWALIPPARPGADGADRGGPSGIVRRTKAKIVDRAAIELGPTLSL